MDRLTHNLKLHRLAVKVYRPDFLRGQVSAPEYGSGRREGRRTKSTPIVEM